MRKELRGRAHGIKPAVHVGKDGISPGLLAEIERTARSTGIVKIKVLPNAFLSPAEAEAELAAGLPGEFVGRVGRMLIYFQEEEAVPPPGPAPEKAVRAPRRPVPPRSTPRRPAPSRRAPRKRP